jgi:hypothetical protein
MVEDTGLNIMESRLPSIAMTSLLNFIKIYHTVQKLIGGTDTQKGRQSPHTSFPSERKVS